MKAFLIILAAVAAMALLGWITFSSGDRPSVAVESDVVRRDVRAAAEATERVARKAAAEGEELAEDVRRTDIDVDVRRERSDGDRPVDAEP